MGAGAEVDTLFRLKKNSLFSKVSSGSEEELELVSRGTSIFLEEGSEDRVCSSTVLSR